MAPTSPPHVVARHWHSLPDGRLACDLCPRHCRLRDGQRGFCFVRLRRGDALVLETYGRSSGFCVDPIEKKPLYHFLPGTPVLSFGTAGCNLGCSYCQNWRMSTSRDNASLVDTAPPEAIAEVAATAGCRSVAFTYNEPVIFLEYAVDVARACHERGLRTIAVTNGYIEPAARADLFAHIDAANVDLKAHRDAFYRRWCSGRLAPVLDTLRYLARQSGCWLEVTNLVIPGLNDSNAELDDLCRFVANELGPHVPLHFSAFHPDGRMRDRPPTPAGTLRRATQIARTNGLWYAYVGNVQDSSGESTVCPFCDATVIGRDRYEITAWGLTDEGACRRCGMRIAGVFDGPAGSWGARCRPVRLGPGGP